MDFASPVRTPPLIRQCRISCNRWTSQWRSHSRAEICDPKPDLVVIGNAISRGNAELEHVLDQRIPFCSLPQLLHDEFLRGKEVLVVAGTHGKTTTTSMLSWIFRGGRARAVISDWRHRGKFRLAVSNWAGERISSSKATNTTPLSSTKGPKFLHYFPDSVILTSVEFDHADIYKDLDAVETAFKRLVNLVPGRGRIIAFDRGESVERCVSRAFCPVERYGASDQRDVAYCRSAPPKPTVRRGPFCVMATGGRKSTSRSAGEYNVWNATAAAAMAANHGIPS